MGFLARPLVIVLRWAMIFLITLAFLTFIWGTYGATCLYWYNTAPWGAGDPPSWQINYHAMESRYKEAGATVPPLYYGSDSVAVSVSSALDDACNVTSTEHGASGSSCTADCLSLILRYRVNTGYCADLCHVWRHFGSCVGHAGPPFATHP